MNKRINFGFSIILLSFVMLCITTFATLTLLTSHSDLKLSQKVADNTTARYQAQEDASYALLALDEKLMQCFDASTDTEGYLLLCSQISLDGWTYQDGLFYYDSAVYDGKYLSVCIKPLRPYNNADTFYETTAWNMNTIMEDTNYSQTLPVITEEK